MKFSRLVLVLALAAKALGCAPASKSLGATVDGEGRRALFIGNSLTYYGDIPGLVQALADSAGGDKIAVATIAGADMALIDHWYDGEALRAIKKGGWEWVILQQGPSSVEVNRDTLRLATKLFAPDIKLVGARPALFSAWPSAGREQDFPRAIESYTLAAADVNGLLLPVAAGWLAARNHSPSIRLYDDGLHPSNEGSYLTALIIYSRLLGKTPIGLPSTLRVHSGAVLTLAPALAAALQAFAAEAVGWP